MRSLVLEDTRRLAWHDVPDPERRHEREAIVRPIAVATCDLDQPMIFGRRRSPCRSTSGTNASPKWSRDPTASRRVIGSWFRSRSPAGPASAADEGSVPTFSDRSVGGGGSGRLPVTRERGNQRCGQLCGGGKLGAPARDPGREGPAGSWSASAGRFGLPPLRARGSRVVPHWSAGRGAGHPGAVRRRRARQRRRSGIASPEAAT
jgi:hypothetical protein